MTTVVPLTVAYVTKGFLSRATSASPGWNQLAKSAGEIGVFDAVCDYAEIVCKSFDDAVAADPTWAWDGVWEYDISERLGEMVGQFASLIDEMPTDDTVRQWVKNLMDESCPMIEVEGVTEDDDDCTAGMPDEKAHFWSVYVRKPDEFGAWLAECVSDHKDKSEALHRWRPHMEREMRVLTVNERLSVEKRVILKTIDILKTHGFALVGGNDGEERHKFTHAVEAIGMVFSVDESWLYFRHPTHDKSHTIYIVLGNDGWDCIADHSTGPLWDEAMAEVDAWIDTQSG